jgi:hypothetical protein
MQTWLLVLLGVIAVALVAIVVILALQGSSSPAPSVAPSAPAASPSPKPTPTATSAPSPTPIATPTPTPTPTPTLAPTEQPTPPPTASPTETPSIQGEDLCVPPAGSETGCPLTAGTYEPQAFVIPMTFELPGGWATTLYTANRFDLLGAPADAGGPSLTLSVALATLSSTDLVASLLANGSFDVSDPADAIVGNVMGRSLDVTNTSSSDVPLFEDAGGSPYQLPAGQIVRLDIIGQGARSIVVARLPTTRDVFPTVIALTQPIVDSMRFFPPKS